MSKKDTEAREAEWLTAFNAGDASGVAQIYAQDGRILPPNSPIVDGRAAIEGFLKEFVASKAQLSFSRVTVHESADLCAAAGEYELEIPGAPTDSGKFVEVWRKDADGSWLIVDDIFNSSLPASTS
jgi:uncharacterized protein (TIGR02246 family)